MYIINNTSNNIKGTETPCFFSDHAQHRRFVQALEYGMSSRLDDDAPFNYCVGFARFGWSCLAASRRHQTCHFRKRATSVPAEGPAYGLDFARHCGFSLRALQAQKWHVHGSRTFGAT